ncbi:MAG: PEPxxWA-CTERM sorting domain-containing protein [Polymorphobacter sp.]
MRIIFVAATALLLAGSAQAVTIVNGSFENGVAVTGGTTTLATDDETSLTGWKILADGVDYVDNTLWNASAGLRSIDLSALSTGGILQRLTGLTVGERYRVRFDLSGNPFDPAARPRDKRLLVSTSGTTPGTFDYSLTAANTATNMLFQSLFYDFTAIGASQDLRFQSLVMNEYGAVLDNVSISVVPEATTWTMLIAGFALVGFAARRRGGVPRATA